MVVDLLEDDGLLDLRPRAPSTAGLREAACGVCAMRPARLACKGCGRGVCAADHWALLGLCRPCAGGVR